MTEFADSITSLLPFVVIFILPLWLFLHYRSRNKIAEKGLSPENIEKFRQLQNDAEHMEERIAALEQILDAKVPNWKERR